MSASLVTSLVTFHCIYFIYNNNHRQKYCCTEVFLNFKCYVLNKKGLCGMWNFRWNNNILRKPLFCQCLPHTHNFFYSSTDIREQYQQTWGLVSQHIQLELRLLISYLESNNITVLTEDWSTECDSSIHTDDGLTYCGSLDATQNWPFTWAAYYVLALNITFKLLHNCLSAKYIEKNCLKSQ